MISPIIYYINLISKIEFTPPASEEKLMEFKNKRQEILKQALEYEREYYRNQIPDNSERTI